MFPFNFFEKKGIFPAYIFECFWFVYWNNRNNEEMISVSYSIITLSFFCSPCEYIYESIY